MVSLDLLKKYCLAFGPSSDEHQVRGVIQDTLEGPYEFITTAHGNLIAYDPTRKGDKTIIFSGSHG